METVLVVDDEEAVLGAISSALRRAGYTVLEARNSAEADGVARTHSGELDLLIADQFVRGMGARNLAERLRADHPAMRVLHISGNPMGVLIDEGALEPGSAFLQKPFTGSELRAQVRRILDQ